MINELSIKHHHQVTLFSPNQSQPSLNHYFNHLSVIFQASFSSGSGFKHHFTSRIRPSLTIIHPSSWTGLARFWKLLLPAHFALLETWISWVESVAPGGAGCGENWCNESAGFNGGWWWLRVTSGWSWVKWSLIMVGWWLKMIKWWLDDGWWGLMMRNNGSMIVKWWLMVVNSGKQWLINVGYGLLAINIHG